jgi:hypothetical protein
MTNRYDVGDEPRLIATFTVSDVVSDPTAAIIVVKKPNGQILSYISSTGWTSQGTWNATTNSPALADGTGIAGHYYTVLTAGTQTFGDKSLVFAVGDYVYYNGKVWRQLQNVQPTTLTKSSTGIYYIAQYLSLPGTWWYGADGVGARTASESYLFVRDEYV